MSLAFRALTAVTLAALPIHAQSIHFIKSLSGPSGHVSGARFVFDSNRSRFVFPQDKSFVVYFEWSAPPGIHVLTGIWKGPDGRVASMSPDVKLETHGEDLHSYWTYEISPSDAAGFYSLDVRVDGEPAGSHPFELVVPVVPPVAKPAAPPAHPTDDEIYKSSSHSLVWVHALDDSGRRLDSSLGFVIAPGAVATSFQAIDGAARLEIQFADGRRARTDRILKCSRLEDWAVIQIETGSAAPLLSAGDFEPRVGEYLRTFEVEAGSTPVLAKLAITGQRRAGSAEGVTLFNPPLSAAASGAPALDEDGRVFGILGANLTPGSHFPTLETESNPAIWSRHDSISAAVPIALLQTSNPSSGTLAELLASGILTPSVASNPALVWGCTTDAVSKRDGSLERTVTEFSRKQTSAWVVTLWQRKAKIHQAVLSAALYDAANRRRFQVASKKFGFGDLPTRVAFPFAPSDLPPGIYRVDVLADDKVTYRTFVTVRE